MTFSPPSGESPVAGKGGIKVWCAPCNKQHHVPQNIANNHDNLPSVKVAMLNWWSDHMHATTSKNPTRRK